MTIDIQSTTDSKEAVTAAMSGLAKTDEVVEQKSAATEKPVAETKEASDASLTDKTETQEETDEVDSSDEVSEESDSKDKKPTKGFKKRIDKLIAKASAAEQRAQYLEFENASLKKSQQTKTETETAPALKKLEDGRPRSDDFENHDAYVEALADWKLEKKLSERDAKTKESQLKSEQQKQIDAHWTKVSEFKKSHDDFDDALEDVEDVPMSITVQQAILESEDSAELMYLLAKNKEEYKKICSLPAVAAAREIGRFEARFLKSEPESSLEKPTITKAPKPIKTVGTASTGSGKKSLDDPNLSQKEYERLRAEQEKSRSA